MSFGSPAQNKMDDRFRPQWFLLIWIAIPTMALFQLPILSSMSAYRGVSPQEEAFYRGETIPCKDGSKTFPKNRLNDDFCDCTDGTDEPGTSACPSGKFHCKNGDPLPIFSSRVNDGICDCCDGSDEYDEKVKCSNTCSGADKTNPKEGAVMSKEDNHSRKDVNEEMEEDFSGWKHEIKPKSVLLNYLDIKLALSLEMAAVFIIFWWCFHWWRKQRRIRRRKRLPR